MSKRNYYALVTVYFLSGNIPLTATLLMMKAPITWWLIAEFPIALISLLIATITLGSNTRGE